MAKNGHIILEDLAAFSKDLTAGCKISPTDNELKVAHEDQALALEDNYAFSNSVNHSGI